MATINQRVGELLQRYADGTCTPAEFNELLILLRLDPDGPEIDAVLERIWETATRHPAEQEVDWDRMRLAILEAAPPMAPVKRLFHFRRVAAAAVIGLLLAGGAWWLIRSHAPEATMANVPKPDAPPGGNKATLYLAGGQTIVLDSAAKGTLARQGAIEVKKTSNGQLAYTGESGGEALPNTRTPQAAAPNVYNTLTTPRGGQYQLVLSDGTKVWLNAASSVTYPTAFAGKNRIVTMTGEAYFEVAKKSDQPFIVRLPAVGKGNREDGSQMDVEVLGTAFNINAYPDENAARTTLVEGSVNVIANGGARIIQPGEQTAVSFGGLGIGLDRNADVEQALAWKNGLFRFGHTSLSSILLDVSRWYDVEVVDSSRKESHFSGVISRNVNLSAVLQLLRSNGVAVKMEGRTVIVQ